MMSDGEKPGTNETLADILNMSNEECVAVLEEAGFGDLEKSVAHFASSETNLNAKYGKREIGLMKQNVALTRAFNALKNTTMNKKQIDGGTSNGNN